MIYFRDTLDLYILREHHANVQFRDEKTQAALKLTLHLLIKMQSHTSLHSQLEFFPKSFQMFLRLILKSGHLRANLHKSLLALVRGVNWDLP